MTLLPILLPEGFSLKVSTGDKIAVGQTLGEGQGSFHEITIHLAHELKLVPQRVLKTLKKNLGDSIAVGDVLAVKKSLIGSQSVLSEFSGIIIRVDEASGDLIIRTNGGEQNLKTITSPVDGVVDSCIDGRVVLKTEKHAILAVDGVGGEASGAIEYLADSDETKLDSCIKGKILLTRGIDKVYVFKTIGLEAAGIVTEQLEDIDFVDLEEKKVRMPIVEVSEEDFKKLVKEKDKNLYLFGKNKSIIVL
jgi:hypothetical protein